MGETNGNHRSIFSMRPTASTRFLRVPGGRTKMAKSMAGFLVAVMAVAAMALASAAGTGMAQAQTNPSTDRAALVALYNATDGPNWGSNINWLSDMPLGEWHGVTTNSSGRVTGLDLYNNQLSGEIPPELGSLTNLDGLHLDRNQLTGEIPPELGSLTILTGLFLGINQLSGEIPAELGSLTNLQGLDLWRQPAERGDTGGSWADLTILDKAVSWTGTNLTGEIPAELGSLSNLEELWLDVNQLSGEIPAELGSLSNLVGLWLGQNQLTGETPAELGRPDQPDKVLGLGDQPVDRGDTGGVGPPDQSGGAVPSTTTS